jgi:hypothetical protein
LIFQAAHEFSLSISIVSMMAAAIGILAAAISTAPAMQRVVLSSGFLCFSNHVGVLRALEAAGELSPSRLGAVVGTSSGAIVGSMLAAGLSVDEIEAVVMARRPLALCRPALQPWRGLFTADPLGRVLAEVLPARFEDLRTPFAAGVALAGSAEPLVISEGALVPAVLASCAVPGMFQPIARDGILLVDGGIADRTAAERSLPWLARAAPAATAETFIHLISDVEGVAFGPRDGVRELAGTTIVRTRRSRQSLARRFGACFDDEVADAAERCAAALAARRASL